MAKKLPPSVFSCDSTFSQGGDEEDVLAQKYASDFYGLKFGDTADVMNLFMLNDTEKSGAVCLDGTPAGFYFSPAVDPANANNWQIYFQGGGWCYDELDCWGRSFSNLGSSTKWAKTASLGGLLSSDCSKNPDFCNYNRVWLVYCDGNSFSGMRTDPLPVVGTDGKVKNLFFRGRYIIDETLKALNAHFGLGSADNVLLTGCSAGGLATYLHTDYVHQQLSAIAPNMKKFKSAPISGFFLEHNTVENKPVYATEMQSIFKLANSTQGLNEQCIRSKPADQQWKCNFAQYAYAHTRSDIFPLNSALDSWQTGCIYTSELPPGFPNQTNTDNGICAAAPGWHDCAGDPEKCDQSQIKSMNHYMQDFGAIMQTSEASATYHRPGNGAFIHSCHTHCEAQSDDFFTFAVNGVTMQQAVSKWWTSDGTDPSSDHSYTPCYYKDGPQGPRKCNPTC
eukprot:CAMPEP_0175152716 /NCGR_PEP_ID=MMETSP0087-20121206/19284_1 /TAXON_ID=136419 /ORGANISM="Unknown Unknown, Strain D1" /LENGTH=449 /DNA_ID=CAMNT_0016439211 /DNA_START=148 /DNA_END=1497 /DNA_ORIENTATION=+